MKKQTGHQSKGWKMSKTDKPPLQSLDDHDRQRRIELPQVEAVDLSEEVVQHEIKATKPKSLLDFIS